MRINVVLMALLLCSCSASSNSGKEFAEAQRLVGQIVAKHPKLIRLTIHAVPTGETENRIIASNIKEKIGMVSDSEDLRVMITKETVMLRERDNLDVTMPILDRAGKVVAAAGITIKGDGVINEKALIKEAEAIAQELTKTIQAERGLPW